MQAGSTLLEVLIALVILSIGLLGFANATLIALRTNQSAYFQSFARVQLDAMTERLRACQQPEVTSPACFNLEVSAWTKENAAMLPAAKSFASSQGAGYQFKIFWRMQSNEATMTSLVESVQP